MTISNEYPNGKFQAVTIRAWHDGTSINQRITGRRNCQTLLTLHNNLKQGITALDMENWAYRLSSFIYILRHQYNLEIETRKERRDGGLHARYFLHTPIEILSIEGDE